MKIVKANNVPIYEVICEECKAVIRYKACEVAFGHITCPVCGVPIWASTVCPVAYEPPEVSKMAEFNLESAVEKGVEAAINKPVYGGKSITEWAAIGMKAPQWISVKDRLPETNVEVLTTYLYDDKPGERYVEPTFYFDDGDGKGHWHLGDEHTFGPVRQTIIAWMPMPEPYKPTEEVSGNE